MKNWMSNLKIPDDPLRLVFVCAMWNVGFDAPCCSTMYLDKPLKNHTLMQTISRPNRVFRDKVNGLIVAYLNIFQNLEQALAIYGSGSGGGIKEGDRPIEQKKKLVQALREAIEAAKAFCEEHTIDVGKIAEAEGFERIKLRDDAVDALLVNDETKNKFLALANNVNRLFKAVLPDEAADEFGPIRSVLYVIAERIRSLVPLADLTDVRQAIEAELDRSIDAEGYEIGDPERIVDLSKIDFEALRKRFEEGRKHIEVERLRGTINSRLRELVRRNKTRLDFLKKFQEMIDEYNIGAQNVEIIFERLVKFAQELNQEEERGIKENLSEEELALFDLLTKPKIELRKKEEKEVKNVSRDLLELLKKEKLVLDWRKRQQTRAVVKVAIRDILDGLPQNYTQEIFQEKCEVVYQHVYDSYYGEGKSVYSRAG